MAALATKAVARWLTKCVREDHPNLLFVPDEANALVTYFMVVGLGCPNRGAEYIFRLESPSDFPKKPPSLRCLTANNVFSTSTSKICISIGEFHTNDRAADGSSGWRPARGLYGFATEVLNAILVPSSLAGGGIGVIAGGVPEGTPAGSAEYNRAHNAELRARFVEAGRGTRAGVRWAQYASQERFGPRAALAHGEVEAAFRAAYGEELAAQVQRRCDAWGRAWPAAMRALGSRFREVEGDGERVAYLVLHSLPGARPEAAREMWELLCGAVDFFGLHPQREMIGAAVCAGATNGRAAQLLEACLDAQREQRFAERDAAAAELLALPPG